MMVAKMMTQSEIRHHHGMIEMRRKPVLKAMINIQKNAENGIMIDLLLLSFAVFAWAMNHNTYTLMVVKMMTRLLMRMARPAHHTMIQGQDNAEIMIPMNLSHPIFAVLASHIPYLQYPTLFQLLVNLFSSK